MDHLVKRTAALGWIDTSGQSSQPVEDAEEVPDTILVGRIIAHKVIPAHAMKGILLKAWAFNSSVPVSELDPNIFLFEFESKESQDRVYARQP